MLELAWFSTKLFLQGKLLRNPFYFYRQITIGSSTGLLVLISLIAIGSDLWLATIVSSLVTGAMMPFLLKDLKIGAIKN